MITDTESRSLVNQSSSSQLGAGFVLMAVGCGLTLLSAHGSGNALLLVLGVGANIAGVALVAVALVRLAAKFEDIHRMVATQHHVHVSEEIRRLRERSS